MKKIKNIIYIISSLIVCFIIIFLIVVLGKKINEINILKKQEESYGYSLENPASVVNGQKTEKIKNENLYFSIEDIAKKYIDNNIQGNVNYLYNVLDSEYISKNKIENNQNLLNNIERYKEDIYEIKNIYTLNGSQYSSFYVEVKSKKNIYLTVNIDFENSTFSVIPSNEKEYNENVNKILENVTGKEKTISLNDFNKYNCIYLSEQQIANKYYLDFKNNIKNNIEDAYNLLDKNTMENKYKNINDFKDYIEKIENSNLKKYYIKSENGSKKIICVTENETNIIFKVTSVMEYSVQI